MKIFYNSHLFYVIKYELVIHLTVNQREHYLIDIFTNKGIQIKSIVPFIHHNLVQIGAVTAHTDYTI